MRHCRASARNAYNAIFCASHFKSFPSKLTPNPLVLKRLRTFNCIFPGQQCPEIILLRDLHSEMDRAVLAAYGWTDILPKCEFIPEFEDEEDEEENGRSRRRHYRYRWPDEIRDEVLARLLELNRQRAIEEGQTSPEAPVFASAGTSTKSRGRKKKAASGEALPSLLPLEEGES
jgi:hypothetical protein